MKTREELIFILSIKDLKILTTLSEDKDDCVRIAIAGNNNTSSEILEKLTDYENW